jgi:NifB/MoaA-like Fe-S oxidoreductase
MTNYAVSSSSVSKMLNIMRYCLPCSPIEIHCYHVQNLVDQEELHKLLIASQQQIEQSKLKVVHKQIVLYCYIIQCDNHSDFSYILQLRIQNLRCSRNNLVISFWKGTGETSVADIFHLSNFLLA